MASVGKRVVAVTGCTRGIGRALLQWFGKEHHVAGCGTAQRELEELRRSLPDALLGQVDICQEDAVRDWLSNIREKWGRIDLLVASAGSMPSVGSVWETPADEWQRACDINILGTTRVVRHAVPLLKPGGLVVLISSRYGRSVVAGKGCYSATKWALEAIAKTLALELRPSEVAAVSLDPGVVNTDMLNQSSSTEEEAAWCRQQRSPEDFAAAVGPFLLSLGLEDTGRRPFHGPAWTDEQRHGYRVCRLRRQQALLGQILQLGPSKCCGGKALPRTLQAHPNLVAPGCPESYYQTGVPYKDRPAWANGFGPFRPAREDEPSETLRKKPRTSEGRPRKYFISGVMLASKKKLKEDEGLVPQNYRQQIADALTKADPAAVIVDPLEAVKARAARSGVTIVDWNKDDAAVKSAFNDVVDMVRECDVIVSNLPEASMGSAVELWEARRAGLKIFTISPMADNWMLRSVTDHNFASIADFEKNLAEHIPSEAA